MLYSIDKKIGVVLVPKTGTSALHKVIADNVVLDYNEHGHDTVEQFETTLIADGHCNKDIHYYGVCRDPVDWFLSCCNYFKHSDTLFKITLLETLGIKQFSYFERHSTLYPYQHIIDYIPVKDVVQALSAIRDSGQQDKINKRLQLWRLQSAYLDYENVTVLSYKDLLASVNTILTAFGCNTVSSIPYLNVTEHKLHTRDNISQEDLAAIRDYCKADYEFFEKKGISLDV